MDFSEHTDDTLADVGKDFIDELHTRVDALPAGVEKRRKERLLAILHRAADGLRQDCADDEIIQPMSGGGPKG